MKNVFSSYHPVVNLLFFCMVIGFGIFIIHPVYLCVALAAALAYGVSLMGKSMVKLFVLGMIPVILVVTVVNMLTNPRGNTVIYHMEYSQITMEAMVFGILTGVLLAAVMMWFACFSKVMTGDKLMFLFGRVCVSDIFHGHEIPAKLQTTDRADLRSTEGNGSIGL